MRGGLNARFPARTPSPLEGEGSVFASLDRRLLTNRSPPVAVALSGGGDSLALLRLAATWASRARRPLLALCVDHGLHPEGPAWTRFAAARAAESGAAFQALAWEGAKPQTGRPAAARAARHALIARAARAAGASAILLGHTADDVAETDHMRAGDAPGIGRLREWSPSPAWPEGRGVMLLRPMLGLRRADMRDWLRARGETWIDDPANADPRFARVRARAAIQGGDIDPADPDAAIEGALAALAKAFEDTAEGGLAVSRTVLTAAGGPAARHVLSVAVLCVGGGAIPPRRDGTQRLLARLRDGPPSVSTLCGARIAATEEAVRLSREAGDTRRRPRPDRDGVVDGRFLSTDAGARYLVANRFRAACFLTPREIFAP